MTRQDTRRQVYLREQHDRAVALYLAKEDREQTGAQDNGTVVASCGDDDVIMLDVIPED